MLTAQIQSSKIKDTGQTVSGVKKGKWIVPLLVNGTIIPFKIDPEAKNNLINETDVKALKEKPSKFRGETIPLKAYNGQSIIDKR